jgi:vacuolar iron transporter family protein
LKHSEMHRSHHTNWLRAAVLGANDGIVSTSSLIIGVAAANASHSTIILTGLAGLIAGAMSMAAGEYVSVSSQADIESADLARERLELATDKEGELKELTHIYTSRGLTPDLAHQVASQLTQHDALAAHARDELGITDMSSAKPLQAALTSAAAFSIGAVLPLSATTLISTTQTIPTVAVISLLSLAFLGGVSAKIGGANIYTGIVRVTFWGILAMVATAATGRLFGVMVN